MVRRTALAIALTALACGGEDPPPTNIDEGPGVGQGGTSDSSSNASSAADADGGDGDCGQVEDESVSGLAPVDIIFLVDTSGSMDFEAESVRDAMNDFSNAISQVDIDVRVTLIADESICVPQPLGSGNCPESDTNPPDYVHLPVPVSSTNALYLLIGEPFLIDQFDPLLRENSVKHVVVVSDDNSSVSATLFDAAFRALGDKYENYRFHAIAASENPDTPPCEDISASKGSVYIELAELRDGVFADLCEQNFDEVLANLATEVTLSTPVACEWDVPDPPEGEMLDPAAVEVELDIDGFEEVLTFVESSEACAGEDGWYYEPDNVAPTTLAVCPATCARLQDSDDAQVSIIFPCELPPEHTG